MLAGIRAAMLAHVFPAPKTEAGVTAHMYRPRAGACHHADLLKVSQNAGGACPSPTSKGRLTMSFQRHWSGGASLPDPKSPAAQPKGLFFYGVIIGTPSKVLTNINYRPSAGSTAGTSIGLYRLSTKSFPRLVKRYSPTAGDSIRPNLLR